MKLKRRIIRYSTILDKYETHNPFVFSRMFLLWALLGLIGGLIAGLYWIVLEFLTHEIAFFEGWLVIPVMATCGYWQDWLSISLAIRAR
ncbi:MAG TPA: hypothetical protein VI413_10425 [Paludibacter sp.]